MTTKREHLMALRRHDWSYMMSDDNSVYRRGSAAENTLITAEDNNPELKGMYSGYRSWWWGLAESSNLQGSAKGRADKVPEPTFGVAME